MSKATHSIKLRNGKSEAEEVTAETLKQLEATIPGFATNYDVTPIEVVEKPATLARPKTDKAE